MNETPETNAGEVILYQSPDGEVRLDVRLENDSVWLTQKQMAELFDRERSVITRHIQRAFADDELSGLPQMIGIREAEKVSASREKGSWSRERSCYYGEPETQTFSLPSRRPRSR